MPHAEPPRPSFPSLLRREIADVFAGRESDRPWQLPFAIALAAGLPVLVGALIGQTGFGAIASIGAMTIVYLPRTRLDLRMVAVMSAACAMMACYALGQIGHVLPALRVPLIAAVALLVTMGCRYYRVGPPGPLFFVMTASIGAYASGTLAELPLHLGVFALGSLSAVCIAFFYSLHILRHRDPLPLGPAPDDLGVEVLAPAVIVAAFVGLSLALAELLGFDKPYWVPVSCIAVLQGATLRAVWLRQLQRIVGTLAGLGAVWGLMQLITEPWHLALAIALLTFCVETIIVRHYALAAVFITPLAILLAEASTLGQTSATPLIIARLADTVLGAMLGVAGGVCLHNERFCRWLARLIAKLAPRR
ncbi:FUSC family protein [Altererythrobacter sp. CC-YST694]|uniref:FUSC family protein n=1 Tax=Altererythrobacter sp. CC-YST694 TaxID=2755038 RepID=UPI001D004BA0|nr:FUSC family protein [Altererythrobacter sp. CC-YST694]MCB5423855.1 FUSC family protein [Altererythrobacter sp. CC-YST694]